MPFVFKNISTKDRVDLYHWHLGFTYWKTSFLFLFGLGKPFQGRFDSVKFLGYVLFHVFSMFIYFHPCFCLNARVLRDPPKKIYSFIFIQLDVYYNYVHVFIFVFFRCCWEGTTPNVQFFDSKIGDPNDTSKPVFHVRWKPIYSESLTASLSLKTTPGPQKEAGSSSSHQFSRGNHESPVVCIQKP